MATQSAERRLQKIHISLMRSHMFALYSGLLMVGETKVVDNIPTACTDGRNKWYGRSFVESLNDKELAFVVMHECLHVAFRHLTTWRSLYKLHPAAANMACDYVINLLLVDTDPTSTVITLPYRDGKPMALYDVKYRGMNSRQVFDDLMKDAKSGGGEGEGEGNGNGLGDGGPPGIDTHDWEKAASATKEEADELAREVDQALRQGVVAQKKIGKGASDLPRELGDLLAPQVNWKDLLREFAVTSCSSKDTSTWRKPNRRFIGHDIYMPSLEGVTVRRVVIGVDTSGSIGAKELNTFLSEVKEVMEAVRPEAVDLLYWGSLVVAHETYDATTMDTLVQTTKPKGGGGTDPTCVETYLEKENIVPDCIIMLTDGYVSSWGSKWNAPILWVVAGNDGCMADTGQTIHIKD